MAKDEKPSEDLSTVAGRLWSKLVVQWKTISISFKKACQRHRGRAQN